MFDLLFFNIKYVKHRTVYAHILNTSMVTRKRYSNTFSKQRSLVRVHILSLKLLIKISKHASMQYYENSKWHNYNLICVGFFLS